VSVAPAGEPFEPPKTKGKSNHSKAPIKVKTVIIVKEGARSGKRIFLKI